jgi:phosphomannomutase
VVDESGHPVSPSAVTALVAARELNREIGATVIHNLITSRAVPELVIERGGTPCDPASAIHISRALMAETGAIFGGEHSAHYYFRDFWGADSGMLAALHVLAALGEQRRPLVGFDGRLSAIRSLRRDQLHRRRLASVRRVGTEVVFGRIQSIDHLDGVTVDLGDGNWFNLRTSNTEPLLRLNVEGRTTDDVDEVVERVAAEIAAQTETST